MPNAVSAVYLELQSR